MFSLLNSVTYINLKFNMGLIRIMERGGSDYQEYKKALKMAKKSIETLCELTEDMESEYGYGERYYGREGDHESYGERGRMRSYR